MKDIQEYFAETNSNSSALGERRLLFLGGLMGLTPSFKGGNGQPLAEAAQAIREEEATPDFGADAEYIERELFVPEDQD